MNREYRQEQPAGGSHCKTVLPDCKYRICHVYGYQLFPCGHQWIRKTRNEYVTVFPLLHCHPYPAGGASGAWQYGAEWHLDSNSD